MPSEKIRVYARKAVEPVVLLKLARGLLMLLSGAHLRLQGTQPRGFWLQKHKEVRSDANRRGKINERKAGDWMGIMQMH
jgi:hypothetical protein